MNTQHKVGDLNAFAALAIPLILGVLGTVLLFSALGTGTVASASPENTLKSLPRQTSSSPAASVTDTVDITKTVEPLDPDTGDIVSICFAIGGLDPKSLDVVLAQDVSPSMNDAAGGGVTQTRLVASQEAASAFVSLLPDEDRVAVVPYSKTAQLAQPLTKTKSAIIKAINNLTAPKTLTSGTNMGEAIWTGHEELITSARHESDTIKTIILLSDGIANCDETGNCSDDPTTRIRARHYVTSRATLAANDGIRFYTIGFGSDADEELLQEVAGIGDGAYFFAPDGDVLETIYLTIASELNDLIITDILTPGVGTDCSQVPASSCTVGPSGATTVTFSISRSLSIPPPVGPCFTATVNLDPNYVGPINLPGSGICHQGCGGQTICRPFNNPTVTVGGRKITGTVFYDVNGSRHRDIGEAGVPSVTVRAGPAVVGSATVQSISTRTDISGGYVLRTSSDPTLSVTIEVPSGYVATTPISGEIPVGTGIYSVGFGIRTVTYLPIIARNYWSSLPTIVNGDFEDGWTGWKHGGELTQAITSTKHYSGSFSALLGDRGYVCQNGVPKGSAWMTQTFSVPHTDHPRLSFSYRLITQDINPYLNDGFDSFDVRIDGDLVFQDAKQTGAYGCGPQGEKDYGWQTFEIDLSAYRGEHVIIRFENRNWPDRWYNTYTYVDAVRFVP